MINPIIVQQYLEEQGFYVEYAYRKRTNMIDLHKFFIFFPNEGKPENVCIWNSEHMGNKLFIETEGGIEKLGNEKTKLLENSIKEAIIESPDNKLTHLFDPIQFISKNFVEEEIWEINEEKIEEQFEIAMSNFSDSPNKERLSYYGLFIPYNNKGNFIPSLFEKLPFVNSVEKQGNQYIVKFFNHCNSMKDELKKLTHTKHSLKSIGIKVEVKSILSVSSYLILIGLYQKLGFKIHAQSLNNVNQVFERKGSLTALINIIPFV